MLKKRPISFPGDQGLRVILDTDCYNECDDQFCVVHALLTPRFDVRAVIAEHYEGVMPNPGSEQKSYDEIRKLVRLMDLDGEVNILHGCTAPLKEGVAPSENEGARFIVEEALREDPRPLFVCTQGALSTLATALRMKPEIAGRMTVLSILGGPYPEGDFEFNLMQDTYAGKVLFQSQVELWQVPMNVYSTMKMSYFEMLNKVYPCGEIGKYLTEHAMEYGRTLSEMLAAMARRFGADGEAQGLNANKSKADAATSLGGELWSLGDSPVVGLMLNNTIGHFHTEDAPSGVLPDGRYDFSEPPSRKIRVYDDIDSRLILDDMVEKLRFYFG